MRRALRRGKSARLFDYTYGAAPRVSPVVPCYKTGVFPRPLKLCSKKKQDSGCAERQRSLRPYGTESMGWNADPGRRYAPAWAIFVFSLPGEWMVLPGLATPEDDCYKTGFLPRPVRPAEFAGLMCVLLIRPYWVATEQSKKQLQILRLRCASLRMTDLWWCNSLGPDQ